MQFGAGFMPMAGRDGFEEFLDSVRAAEAAGFDRAWVLDSQVLWGDLYIYISHALAATERIVMGTAVTNPVTRHITVTASAHVTLEKLYPGRVVVNMGRGNTACTTIGLKPMRLAAFEQSARDLKALIAGDSVEMNGKDVRVVFADKRLPLVMPATGPKMLDLAGRNADVVHLDIGADLGAVEWAIGRVHDGARSAGRDPRTLRIGVWAPIFVSDDGDAARAFARPPVENQLKPRWTAIAKQNPDLELPDAITRLIAAEAPDSITVPVGSESGRPGASEVWRRDYPDAGDSLRLTDDVIDEHVVAGSADKCIERIRALNDVGVHELCATVLNNEFDQIQRIGEEILPAIRGLTPPQA